MSHEIRQLNRRAMAQALSDAEVAIQNLRQEVQRGEHDLDSPMTLAVPFQYIVWQLCIAWHSRWLSDSELDLLSEAEHDLMRDSIPNWGLAFRLVDIDEPKIFNPRNTTA